MAQDHRPGDDAPVFLGEDLLAWLVLAVVSALLAAPGVLGPTTCAGFERPERGPVPAYVWWSNVDELLLR